MTYVPADDGRWVNEEFARLAEIIQDYSNAVYASLELRWIPSEHRTGPEDRKNPYAVVDTRTNYIVFTASELDTPTDILARLFDIDNKDGDLLKRLEAHNAAVEAMRMKRYMDELEATRDFKAFVFQNEKNYWVHDGRKRDAEFRDLGPIRQVIE
jgi:hypothetical protein